MRRCAPCTQRECEGTHLARKGGQREQLYLLRLVLPLCFLTRLAVGVFYMSPGEGRVAYAVALALALLGLSAFKGPLVLPRDDGHETWLKGLQVHSNKLIS